MKHSTRKRRPPGCHDIDLQKLWRKVVRAVWKVCALGPEGCGGELECHHIRPRRIPHLRHNVGNGILLCKAHHAIAKRAEVMREIERIIGPDTLETLDTLERVLFPDFLEEARITRREFFEDTKAYLMERLAKLGGGE